MDLVDCLMKAGFSRHESILYMALCKEGELTGYEAAKVSGIPRSNAYLALAGLVDKGAACRIDSEAARYIAVPPKELVENTKRQLWEVLDFIERNTPVREEAAEPYITVAGRLNIINKMKNIVKHASERVYISMAAEDLENIRQEIIHARDRGLKVVVITSDSPELEGLTVYLADKQPGQIRLIADTSQVLTGELTEGGNPTCLYSRNKNLVALIKDSLTNEIQLIKWKRGG